MKKFLLAGIILISFAACGSGGEKAENAKYQCPMKCEGEKNYDSAGQCAMCKMDLEPVK